MGRAKKVIIYVLSIILLIGIATGFILYNESKKKELQIQQYLDESDRLCKSTKGRKCYEIELIDKALKINPNHQKALLKKALMLSFLCQNDKAGVLDCKEPLKILDQLLALGSKNPAVHNERAVIFNYFKDYKKANDEYNKVLEIDQYYQDVYLNKGNVLLKMGEKEEAIQVYKKEGSNLVSGNVDSTVSC